MLVLMFIYIIVIILTSYATAEAEDFGRLLRGEPHNWAITFIGSLPISSIMWLPVVLIIAAYVI